MFRRLRAALSALFVKAAALSFTPPWLAATFMDIAYRTLVKEGYKGNAGVFAVVTYLARTFPEPPFRVYKPAAGGPQAVNQHPCRQLLRRPNPHMSEDVMWAYVITYMAIGGNAYLWKERNRRGVPIALWPLSDGQMSPIPGGDNWIDHYSYDPGDGHPQRIPIEDVLHFRWAVDPEQPIRGLSPLVALARDVDIDTEAARYVKALLQNDAAPRTILNIKGSMPGDDTVRRIKAQFTQNHGGEGRGGVAIVGGDVTISRMALNLSEMEFQSIRDIPESRIAAAFGVPAVMVGLNVGLQRSIQGAPKEMQASYTQLTLVPMWRAAAAVLEAHLLPDFGDPGDLEVQPDLSAVSALQTNLLDLWSKADAAVAHGWLTMNQALRLVGQPELGPDGDVYLRGAAVMTVPLHEAAPLAAAVSDVQDAAAKGLPAPLATKALSLRQAEHLTLALRAVTEKASRPLASELGRYFAGLAGRVASRYDGQKALTPALAMAGHTNGHTPPVETKVRLEALLPDDEERQLRRIFRSAAAVTTESVYATVETALGLDAVYDEADPSVLALLGQSADRVQSITATTRDAIRRALTDAESAGYSTYQTVHGVPADGYRGLRAVVEETYRGRAETIARTETMLAAQASAVDRYQRSGIDRVQVVDGDDDELCRSRNGSIVSIEEASSLYEHPNGTMVLIPIVD